MKRFPETLFVKCELPGTENEYLAPSGDIEELAEIGETVKVAEYVFVRMRTITTKPSLSKPKR